MRINDYDNGSCGGGAGSGMEVAGAILHTRAGPYYKALFKKS